MIIRNFYDEKLAQASYLVGCGATGQAIVIDPLRDIAPYLSVAANLGLRITAVTETHIHADFLSGSRELASQAGATIYLSDEGGPDWQYSYGKDANVVLMKDGHVIVLGNLSLRAIHTPGHTPEHLTYLLTDHPASETPHSLFTGDFVFVGDVGRPDLLERAANIAGTMEIGARQMYRSLQKLNDLPDSVLLWPGHGAGSACGKSLGGSPVTALGYERQTNWALQIHDEDKFVDEILSGQPEPPVYFKEMKRLNKLGPTILGSLPRVPPTQTGVGRLVDVRDIDLLKAGFLPGSIAIPSGNGLTNWAGWLLDYGQPVTLIASSQEQADEAARDMATIGLDIVAGWIEPSRVGTGRVVPEVDAATLTEADCVLDVRGTNEWKHGHIKGAVHIPLGLLPHRLAELPRDRRIVVHCAGGSRSPIGVGLLLNAGFDDVAELAGGFMEVADRQPGMVTR
ncbi:MAG: MBL fold metallo-hydrolase [Armatimonadetes bacterium]|nr:MBL fold metallo-hydrolase [Armatimonadota bacterium]